MEKTQPKRIEYLKYQSFALIAFFLLLLIVISPQDSLQAARKGLKLWLDIVLPSLLPFLIASEIMIGTGVVNFLSVLLEPIMNPLFRCPGYSSFIWVMSISSGYPMGAKLVASFNKDAKLTRAEGQRILAFCSTSGPLFMISAVGIGMLGSSDIGIIIALSHYIASLLLGIIFRYYGPNTARDKKKGNNPIKTIRAALDEIYNVRKKNNRSMGEILGYAVKSSMDTIFLIGGFIILFSVLIDLMFKSGIIQIVMQNMGFISKAFGLSVEFQRGLWSGILEITTGCQIIGQSPSPVMHKLIAVSFLIGWSGLSIHSQVASILGNTNISIGIYIITKLFHGLLAAIICPALATWLYQGEMALFSAYPPIAEVDSLIIFQGSCRLLMSAIIALVFFALISLLIQYINNQLILRKKIRV